MATIGTLILGAAAVVVYFYYQVKMSDEQESGKFWYYYPANETIILFALVQFACTLLLIAAPQKSTFEFCLLTELTFLATYLFHFYLCYHKVNPFLPTRWSARVTRLNRYRIWKAGAIYAVPAGLLFAHHTTPISRSFLIGFYIAPLTVFAGGLAYWMFQALSKNGDIIWKLAIRRPSTYLMRQQKEYCPVYISVNLFNGNPEIEHTMPRLSLWRKVVYFSLFESTEEAQAYYKRLSELDDKELEMLICQQNPAKENRTDWIVRKSKETK